jgi:hypothetical protein
LENLTREHDKEKIKMDLDKILCGGGVALNFDTD